ncbi:MAG TPA: methyl-accepting chemotaxis protein [Ktedonobacteraceae bacterium]|nr:methyl-accepting chemotaxis protein [Ktedonobacteraceae bacterium]
MSEKKQNLFVPIRVRFRSPVEQARSGNEHPSSIPSNYPSTMPGDTQDSQIVPQPGGTESAHRTQQIKELIRLGNVLRAELGLNDVLQQIVASINAYTGFQSATINLVKEESNYLLTVAFTGSSDESERLMRERHITVEQIIRVMRPEFRISQSYFIPHEYINEFADIPIVIDMPLEKYETGGWHPEDGLIIPLYSPRKQKLLGFLSLDEPVNGRIPTLESIEMLELFANQAAIAIDSALIFQEREAERVSLEEAIVLLRQELEQVQRGDLRVRVQTSHQKLQPVVEAINITIKEISEILGSVQMVTHAVDEHAQDVQRSSEVLVRDTAQQEQQVGQIWHIVDEMAGTLKSVTEHSESVSFVARDASDVTTEGQNKVVRAADGMRQVRETTMHSAHIMKRLGESSQEINDTVLEITDLTARMNLLALNAAIEAVRAGEQGQGFAAIAQEIRSLAVHSAEASRKVAARLRAIQSETAAVSLSVEQNIQQVVIQTELVTQTGVALEAISIVTEQMADLVQNIWTAAESQSQSSKMVVLAVDEISRMSGEIAGQTGNLNQSLAHLVELTNSLRSRMSVFNVAG